MAGLKKLLTSRLFLAFIGMVFVSLFIWFAGPLIGYNGTAPLESTSRRYLLIGGMSTLWFLSAIYRFIKSRMKNAKMLDALAAEAASSATGEASAEELATLQSKMQEAVDTLKNKNFSKSGGKRFLYQLPWYVIIGPPGAGKTTLLSNSGLDFPLEETHGKFSVKGIGGTRNCDWWFTDQAVLLDTAGRYTTQDSEAEVDKSAWEGFLDILKNTRGRRPLNGVLLAISIEDILNSDDDQLAQIAKTLRNRVDELYKVLGIAPPVYLMFTKCDLLAGFNEHFSNLDKRSREQVWGYTLPIDSDHTLDTSIDKATTELSTRLHEQTITRLHGELSARNRENVFSFPMQFNFFQQRVDLFVGQLAAQSRLLENILFRGVYFTSATQTGSVLDQVIQSTSQNFGINERLPGSAATEGKSFFITELLKDVVFSESGLAGTNLATERKLKWLQWGAAGCISAVFIGLLALWTTSYFANRQLLESVQDSTQELIVSLDELSGDNLDLLKTSSALNKSRKLITANDDGFVVKRAGMYQGNRIGEFAEEKYQDLLIDALLPRLMVRLEHQMHAQSTNSEFVFEALKTYQMLNDREHYKADAVIGWFNFDFDTNLPPDTSTANRNDLKAHVTELFKERPYRLPRPVDSGLINQYQLIAATTPIEQRAYNRIRNSSLGNINEYLRLTEGDGADLPLAFTRSDDISLDNSVPRFFTLTGYRDVFLPASSNISAALADDRWVLGAAADTATSQITPEQLQVAVQQRYYKDYIMTWETLLQALQLRSVDGLQAASEFVALLSAPDSPIKKILTLARTQTTLTKASVPEESEAKSTTDRENQLGSLLGGTTPALPETQITLDPVTIHFSKLHKLVENVETNASPLDQVLNQLAQLNLQLLPMAQSPAGSIDTRLNTELAVNMQKISTHANRLPGPLANIVNALTNDIGDVVGGGFCQQLDAAWKTDVYAYYIRAIANRYPVNRNGTTDIALSDFGSFFSPGGIVDTFVSTYLATQVSKSPKKWTWVGKGSSVCLSDNSLKQLARFDDIKNTFFSQGGPLPSFRFDLVPERINMSIDIEKLILNIASAQVEYNHGPVNGTTSFSWPDQSNNTQVNLRVEPVVPGSSSSLSMSGPWAVLKLFDQANRNPTRTGLDVSYSFSGRSVALSLATSSFNPLNSVSLRNFRAPENL